MFAWPCCFSNMVRKKEHHGGGTLWWITSTQLCGGGRMKGGRGEIVNKDKQEWVLQTLVARYTLPDKSHVTFRQSNEEQLSSYVYSFFILVFVQHTFIEPLLHAWYCSTLQVLWWPYGPVMYLNVKNYLHDARLWLTESVGTAFFFLGTWRNLSELF